MTRAEFIRGLTVLLLGTSSSSSNAPDGPRTIDLDDVRAARPGIDAVTAMAVALEQLRLAGGGTLQLGAGIHELPSTALGRNGLSIPGNTVICGVGRGTTELKVTGASACNILSLVNVSNVTIRDLTLRGNGVSLGEASGAAVMAFLLSSAREDMEAITIENVHLVNFAAPYWVQIENDYGGTAAADLQTALGTGTRTMRGVRLRGISAQSQPGNSLAPSRVTVHAHVLRVSGFSGYVEDITIDDLQVAARHIKGGISIGQRVRKVAINRPVITDAGRTGARDDAAAYAIELYDTFYNLTDVTIDRPRITNARSCGLYVAGCSRVTVIDPAISGQSDTFFTTLPKGAIVFNGTLQAEVRGGFLSNNFIDVHISAPSGAEHRMGHVVDGVRTTRSAFRSLFISYTAVHAVTSGIRVTRCDLNSDGCAVAVQNGPHHRIDDIVLEGCSFSTTRKDNAHAVDWYVDSGSTAQDCGMRRCTVTGTVRVREITGRFFAVDTQASCSAPGGIAFQFYGCPALELIGCTGAGIGRDGIAFDLRSSSGMLERCRAVGCRTVSLGDLGRTVPVRRGSKGQFVQNLYPVVRGTGAAAYVVDGWRNAGGVRWAEQRRRP